MDVELNPEQLAALAQARTDHLAGRPGELHMAVTVTKPDGRTIDYNLVGRVTGTDGDQPAEA